MKIIDDNIYAALHKLKLVCGGTNAELGRKLGLSRAYIGKLINGKSNYFEEKTWERIEPILRPYIKGNKIRSDAEPVVINPEGKVFPVISEAAAVSCNTAYIPIADFAIENSDELRYFDLGLPGDIAIRITGESMLPWYPPGTLVLIRPNARPQNGQRVIAILGDGEVVFKIFSETKDHIHLLSINDHDGEDMHFAKNDYQAIRNLFVVIQSVRDELRLDQAMDEAGIKHRWQNKIKDYE